MSLQEYFAAKMAAKRNSSSNLLDLADKTPSPDPDTTGKLMLIMSCAGTVRTHCSVLRTHQFQL